MTDVLGFDGGLRRLPTELTRQYIPTPFNRLSNTTPIQHQQNIVNLLRTLNPILGPNKQMSMMDFNGGFSYGKTNKNFGYIISLNQKTDYKFYTDVKYGEYQRTSDKTDNELIYATKQTGQLTEINNFIGGLVGFNYVKGKNK